MNRVIKYFSTTKKSLWVTICNGSTLFSLLMLISFAASGQDGTFENVGKSMWKQAGNLYKLMSVIVFLGALFFLGKGVLEGIRGEQGAWVKIAGALLVFAVWVFGVPPLINYLTATASDVTIGNNF